MKLVVSCLICKEKVEQERTVEGVKRFLYKYDSYICKKCLFRNI